jgi:hypothetical protein
LSSRLLSRDVKVKIYKTITLPVVLCGCETWVLTLTEEHRLRVFENRVLRIVGPKKDEITRQRRNMYSGELHNLYSPPDAIRQIKFRRMRWAGLVAARMGVERKVHKVLMGMSQGKRPLGRPRRRWEDGIKMDFGEIGWRVFSGFTWLRIGICGWFSLMR